jgi:Rrf2 family protein
MKANHQFSIAVHLMTCLGNAPDGMTSGFLAGSVNTSPSFIRRTLSKLAKAKLIKTTLGKSGTCALAKDAKKISMLDIYDAVEAPSAFAIHQYPTQKICPISCKIKSSLEKVLLKTQKSMEASLKQVSLAQLISDVRE